MKQRNNRKWDISPLYDFLVSIFPAYVYDGTLDIPALASDLDMSREGIYKWMRTGRLSKAGATKLYAHARQHSPQPPRMEEIAKFVFA